MPVLSPTRKFPAFLAATACLGVLLVSGCGGSSAPSPSIDATCADFGKMSESDQKATAQLVLDANGVSTDGLAAGAKITAGRAALTAYCAASGDTAVVKNVTDIGAAVDSISNAVQGATGSTGATGQK